jgi:16S rRNA (guanine527-N7)-methyltransferase
MGNSLFNTRPEGILQRGAEEIGLHLEPGQVEAFFLYAEELSRWNRKMNLTRIREGTDLIVKHFLASLAFTAAFPRELPLRLVDIGSGAGFPGIPIKIACPHLYLTLIEASRKKVSFLRHVCTLLKLREIEVVRARAEELASDRGYGGRFDVAVVRAVGSPEGLIGMAGALLRLGGRLILSAKVAEERSFPEGGGLAFKDSLRVRFPSVGLERKLLIWEKSD